MSICVETLNDYLKEWGDKKTNKKKQPKDQRILYPAYKDVNGKIIFFPDNTLTLAFNPKGGYWGLLQNKFHAI